MVWRLKNPETTSKRTGRVSGSISDGGNIPLASLEGNTQAKQRGEGTGNTDRNG